MIELGKEYVTKGDGLPVRIYCTDGGGDFPVHGAYYQGGKWWLASWPDSGNYHSTPSQRYNLIEKPQTVTRWVNVHDDGHAMTGQSSRAIADGIKYRGRIGVLRIEVTGDKYEVFKEDV